MEPRSWLKGWLRDPASKSFGNRACWGRDGGGGVSTPALQCKRTSGRRRQDLGRGSSKETWTHSSGIWQQTDLDQTPALSVTSCAISRQ